MDITLDSATPQRVDELWFDDGNLVIQAGDSLYRVYRGLLATHSSVFRDMLAFPQPVDSELVDGCPLVRLPDPDVEVTPFLKAILVPDFFMPFPAPTECDAVVGCLRLSHKYGVDYLRKRALVHFSANFPTTLSQLNRLLADDSDDDIPAQTSWVLPDLTTSAIGLVQVAREVQATWALPRALYLLSAGFIDGEATSCANSFFKYVHAELSEENRNSYLRGRHSQSTAAVNIFRFLSEPLDIVGCADRASCYSKRLRATRVAGAFIADYRHIPLEIWTDDDWAFLKDLCPACMVVLKQTHQDALQDFWDKLPDMYNLPSWKELEQMKTAAIG
ncbi:hypothetical protein C8R46DRAFT_1064691, partial [Mycena filopes]